MTNTSVTLSAALQPVFNRAGISARDVGTAENFVSLLSSNATSLSDQDRSDALQLAVTLEDGVMRAMLPVAEIIGQGGDKDGQLEQQITRVEEISGRLRSLLAR